MSLLTADELRALVQTGLDDADLQRIIDREEAEVIAQYGAHYTDASTPVSEVVSGGGCNLFLKRRISAVSSIAEASTLGGTATTLTASQYYVWPGQGRITRLPEGTAWGSQVTVSYVPADDRPLRRQVLIELVRLALEQTAMQSESVAGEYSYQAPDWETKRKRLLKRIGLPNF